MNRSMEEAPIGNYSLL